MSLRSSARNLVRPGGVCPYCKDDLTREASRQCPECGTAMHVGCFEEYGKCTSIGCSAVAESMPSCGRCDEPLGDRNAVVCVRCGWHQLEQRPIGAAAPSTTRPPAEERIAARRGALDEVEWDLSPRAADRRSDWRPAQAIALTVVLLVGMRLWEIPIDNRSSLVLTGILAVLYMAVFILGDPER